MKRLLLLLLFLFIPTLGSAQTNTFCASNLACTVTGVWGFSQPITATFTFTNHNAMYWAGPGATPTIDQAVANCGANPCWVEISPLYTGPESTNLVTTSLGYTVYSGALNVTVSDRRGSVAGGGLNYSILYGGRLAGQLVRMGVNGWSSSPTDSTGASTSINWVTGTMPTNGGTQNGSVSVVISHDTVNVGTGNVPWVGQDGECDITATVFDFPVNNCYGTNGQTNIVRANGAQSIINAVGQHAAVNSNVSSSGAQMINSYGVLNEAQSAGVGRNYSEYNRGNTLFDTETQIHSLIFGPNVTITAATESTQIVTITASAPCSFTTNQEVVISGVTPTAYNGRYFVRSPGCNGGSTFTYFHPSSAALGVGTAFGIANGYTPQTTTYFRNTNIIQHNPLSDTQGWQWQTIGGSLAFRIIPGSLITAAIPFEYTGRWFFDETTVPSAGAATDSCYGDSTAHAIKCSYNNGTYSQMPQVIASGTSTLTVNAALAAVTSQAAITTAATGALTTDAIEWSYASAPGAGDSLCHISPYVTAGNVNFVRTNPTAGAQSVSAIVINWRVIR